MNLYRRLRRALVRRLPQSLRGYVHMHRAARAAIALSRPPDLRLMRGLIDPGPELLEDRETLDVDSINRSSQEYFTKAENHAYWLNRPFSDPASAPHCLARFGLLLGALRPGSGDRILDFGCGTGWTSIFMAKMGADVIGMDIAPAALAIASEAADRDMDSESRSRIRFQPYAGSRIDADDGVFDTVVVFDAFHHFPNPMMLLEEFHRVLGPHGLFGFAEPGIGHAASESSKQERAHGVLEEDVHIEQLYRSAMSAGFRDLEVLIPPLDPEQVSLPMRRARWYLRGVPGLLPQDFLRTAILTGPMGVFRKGPHAVTSLHPRSHQAALAADARSVRVTCGETFFVDVEARNPSETVWLREGRCGVGVVRVGAHLLEDSGNVIDRDYGRADLPHDVGWGESVRVRVTLRAPEKAGVYRIQLDMVNEGICWFGQMGSSTLDIPLEVGATPGAVARR